MPDKALKNAQPTPAAADAAQGAQAPPEAETAAQAGAAGAKGRLAGLARLLAAKVAAAGETSARKADPEDKAAPSLDDAAQTAAEAPPDAATPATSAAKGEATLIGVLDADQRIRKSTERTERALWAGAIAATLIYAGLIAGQMAGILVVPVPMEQRQKERRGQGAPDSISVELVPDPDRKAKTKRWQEGANAPGPQPDAPLTQPPQTAALEQPEMQETKPEKTPADEPRPEGSPMLLDIDSLVDAAAADFKRNLDHALAKKPQKERREQQAANSGGGLQIRGTGASGRSDPFTRSVIAALMKTRPGPFALWGRVLVSFQITEAGELRYVHLLQSSGNSALDQAAIDAIRKARFQRPPPGLPPDSRTYIIDYIFG